MKLEMNEVLGLIDKFVGSGLGEMEIESEGTRLSMKKACNAGTQTAAAYPAVFTQVTGNGQAAGADAGNVAGQTYNAGVATDAGIVQGQPAADASNLITVKAPIAGIFYRASSPDDEPFVKEGSEVKKGDTIGLMEAMKLMNEIPSPCDGVVREIIAKDSEFCEFDKPILTIVETR